MAPKMSLRLSNPTMGLATEGRCLENSYQLFFSSSYFRLYQSFYNFSVGRGNEFVNCRFSE